MTTPTKGAQTTGKCLHVFNFPNNISLYGTSQYFTRFRWLKPKYRLQNLTSFYILGKILKTPVSSVVSYQYPD